MTETRVKPLLARVTWREACDAAEILRNKAASTMLDDPMLRGAALQHALREAKARAEALRRVADWIEEEAMR